ncbi:MAG TPA: metalloregulator ArsR/SmtB family transcription factor [Thermoplasmata archaeon]|nr:metalloregulator ArsR/SmtB family transcription factor [Thermoplasmata archaeon]
MWNPGQAFGILAEPTRLRIVERLRVGEQSVGELVSRLSVCEPGVSRHLRILHQAGFVQVRAEGQRHFYSLRRLPFQELDEWVHEFRDVVEGRLDRLGKLIELDASASHPIRHRPGRTQP